MAARALALDGARLILIPTYGSRTRIRNGFVMARARENGVAVVQANRGMNMMVSSLTLRERGRLDAGVPQGRRSPSIFRGGNHGKVRDGFPVVDPVVGDGQPKVQRDQPSIV